MKEHKFVSKDNTLEKSLEESEEKVITLDDVENVDKLLDCYYKGEAVKFPEWVQQTDKGLKIVPQELAIYIIDNFNILCIKMGNSKGITLYKYQDGRYALWNESEAKAFIKKHLPRKIRTPRDWDYVYKELVTEATNTEENELNQDEDIINWRNGILNIRTMELLEHSYEYKCTIQIPCNYVANASLDQAPIMSKFLNDITSGNEEDKITLLECIGLAISNVSGPRFKKLLILKGKR